MKKEYFVPFWISHSKELNGDINVFNWSNNKSVILFDKDHPAYSFFKKEKTTNNYLSETYSEDISWLYENSFIKKHGEEEKLHKEPKKDQGNSLHLIILPAGEACNLDCIYCYEDHSSKKRMDSDSVKKIMNFIKAKSAQKLDIEYFGGEPMLNIKFIEELSESLKDNKIIFSASITTNGTLLTDRNLSRLYNSGVRSFQITIDGSKNLHNKLRVSRSKNLDSYESVCAALRTISNSSYPDITCSVRINSNKHTIERNNLENFISDIKKIIPPSDRRFFILPKPIGDYSSANLKSNLRAEDSYCSKESTSEVVKLLEEAFSDQGYMLADPLLLTKKGGYSCYAGKANSFVINPDLDLFKCTVALDDPINHVGKIENNGELNLNKNFDYWTKDYSDSNCSTCRVNNSCQGNSCPLINIKQNKKICPPINSQIDLITTKLVKFFEAI